MSTWIGRGGGSTDYVHLRALTTTKLGQISLGAIEEDNDVDG
jgi:hypothetical protein